MADDPQPLALVPQPSEPSATSTSDDASPAKRIRGKPFEPGNRANPGGRPRKDARLTEALTRLSFRSIEVYEQLLADAKTPRETKRKICEYLFDRRLGKPTTAIGNPDGSALLDPGAPVDSPIAQIIARLAARRNAAASADAPAPTEPENAQPGASGGEPRGAA
jgi:hypothetical protein